MGLQQIVSGATWNDPATWRRPTRGVWAVGEPDEPNECANPRFPEAPWALCCAFHQWQSRADMAGGPFTGDPADRALYEAAGAIRLLAYSFMAATDYDYEATASFIAHGLAGAGCGPTCDCPGSHEARVCIPLLAEYYGHIGGTEHRHVAAYLCPACPPAITALWPEQVYDMDEEESR